MATDPQIDDILARLKKSADKKPVNSARKGKRGEKLVVDRLSERFGLPFTRVPQTFGSGAWSTNNEDYSPILDLDHLAGDIIVPKGFKFVIECKFGYDIDLFYLFGGNKTRRQRDSKQIRAFVEQASRDAKRVGKLPVVVYHKDNSPAVVFLSGDNIPTAQYNIVLKIGDSLICVSLDEWLDKNPDNYFFDNLDEERPQHEENCNDLGRADIKRLAECTS